MGVGDISDIPMYGFKERKMFLEDDIFEEWNYGFYNLFLTICFYFRICVTCTGRESPLDSVYQELCLAR